MAFTTQPVEEQVFDSLEDLNDYLLLEKDRLSIVPIENFIKKGAVFIHDEYYGKNPDYVCFNEDGFRSFCYAFKLPMAFLQNLPEAGLASRNLNDYFSQEEMKEKLKIYSFVIDVKNKTVVGVVTNSYVGYSNATFLEEVEQAIPDGFNSYEFTRSYLINTRLHLRLLSRTIEAGMICKNGDTKKDVSKIGIECRNSMVGDSSVRVSYFIRRLICANGLTVQSKNAGIVYHRGNPETFNIRIKKNIRPVIRSLRHTAKFIEKLMEIPYSPETLVVAGGANEVYKVLALYPNERVERKSLTGKRIRQFDIEKIRQYPERFGGMLSEEVFNSRFRDNQSMFDFVNIFTEFAKTQSPRKRLETEEKAGNLASWIMKNKRKFL